jgi:hypothetical protein
MVSGCFYGDNLPFFKKSPVLHAGSTQGMNRLLPPVPLKTPLYKKKSEPGHSTQLSFQAAWF